MAGKVVYKVGDIVRCIKPYGDRFTVGKLYEVYPWAGREDNALDNALLQGDGDEKPQWIINFMTAHFILSKSKRTSNGRLAIKARNIPDREKERS